MIVIIERMCSYVYLYCLSFVQVSSSYLIGYASLYPAHCMPDFSTDPFRFLCVYIFSILPFSQTPQSYINDNSLLLSKRFSSPTKRKSSKCKKPTDLLFLAHASFLFFVPSHFSLNKEFKRDSTSLSLY